MKMKKHDINIEANPKMDNVGDYWDKETIIEVFVLLKEREYIFPRTLLEMKGIIGDIWEMKIQRELDAKTVKKIP